MNFSFLDVLLILAVMLLMIVPGYILKRKNMVEKAALGTLVVILLYVCQPFLTIKAFVMSEVEPTKEIAINMLIMFALSIVVHLLGFIFIKLFFIRGKDRLKNGAYTICSLFSNAGFIGIPFIELLTHNDTAVIYATVYMVAFNMLIWTLGVYIITGDIKMMKPFKGITNPAVIVLAIALPMFFVPEINIFKNVYMFGEGVKFFAGATLPLSMLIVGIRMGGISIKSLFSSLNLYIVSFIKLVFAPLLSLLIMLPFILKGTFKPIDPNNYIILVLVMLTAIPPAASSIAMSEKYKGDVDTAVRGFLLATILSIATMPFMLILLLKIISV